MRYDEEGRTHFDVLDLLQADARFGSRRVSVSNSANK